MLCLDEISQSDTRQLLPDTVDVDTQGIIINIKLIIPKEIHNITARTYFPCVLKKIVKDFQFVFRQLGFLSVVFYIAAL